MTNVISIDDARLIRDKANAINAMIAERAQGHLDLKTQREERKRLGRERQAAVEPIKGTLEFKAEVRRRLALIAHLEGVPAMISWVENECLAAWKVRSCTNE